MCDLLFDSKLQESNSESTTSESEANNGREAFTILEVEVNKSALNFPTSCDESSSSSQEGSSSVGDICQLQICQDIVDYHSGQEESEGREAYACRGEAPSIELRSHRSSCKSRVTIEEEPGLEYTLAIIRPEGLIYKAEIERLIVEEGFSICQTRWLQLTPEQVSDFYHDNYEQESFAQLLSYVSSGPILVYVISKMNAIEDWKKLIGPERIADARIYAPDSIRGKYGKADNEMRKLVHGSADKNSAEKEIKFFFPDRKIEKLISEEVAIQYLWKEINEALTEALIKCCEEKPGDPIVWLGNYLLDYKTNVPKYLMCKRE